MEALVISDEEVQSPRKQISQVYTLVDEEFQYFSSDEEQAANDEVISASSASKSTVENPSTPKNFKNIEPNSSTSKKRLQPQSNGKGN